MYTIIWIAYGTYEIRYGNSLRASVDGAGGVASYQKGRASANEAYLLEYSWG